MATGGGIWTGHQGLDFAEASSEWQFGEPTTVQTKLAAFRIRHVAQGSMTQQSMLVALKDDGTEQTCRAYFWW
ncbi:hypothetical protein B9Z45_02515 [Limnohabitans sp. 2KL-17]|nr:hypothetical protein B9Z45_02515 [Limnohabitans sp. 2KL-17]